MLTKRLLPLFFAFLMVTTFAGCKKDEDKMSKRDMLTSGQWRITAVTATPPIAGPGGMTISDLYAFMQPCIKDDFYVFKKDGTVEINEGPTKCDPADPQTSSSNWSLSSDENQITIDGDSATILELTNSRFRISGSVPGPNGNVTAEITFTK